MSPKSLEDVLEAAGSPVKLLRESQTGPNVYPGVPPEYTNWRDETRAWQDTAVLFNQSYHMADLLVEGPDALKLLTHLGVNSMANFAVDKAKQFVPCSYDGYVIGDVILFYLAENQFNLVGRTQPPATTTSRSNSTSVRRRVRIPSTASRIVFRSRAPTRSR
jgi:glycine cleavage system aminomethyltransferase T